MTSHEWRLYYEHNAQTLLDIPWSLGAELTAEESKAIRKSLRAFQAGESSEGKHLFKYAKAYAAASGDHAYVVAIRLFIAEEQRHARDLGRFLTLNQIPLVKTTFTDLIFRKLRHVLAGLEISIAVLVTAEIIAMVYYAAIREATQSFILRRLCDQILRDEIRHIQFQTEQLTILRSRHSRLRRALTTAAQRVFFAGTTLLVGVLHRRALARGGFGTRRWWKDSWSQFETAFKSRKSLTRGGSPGIARRPSRVPSPSNDPGASAPG